ncbi:MAG TPA: hypothetical protein OIL76_10505 [Veillonellaceae bacterium]|nr:hypothetical protein [Veillonellaceae bacterium]
MYHCHRKLFAASFPPVWMPHVYHHHRKPFASSFLPVRMTKV